jgi:transcriptional regulator with XRE-family HTH domain
LKDNVAISLVVPARSPGRRPGKARIQPAFGKLMAAERERLGLSQAEAAKLAGYESYLTAWRVETAAGDASINAAIKIRNVLVARGASLPPDPTSEDVVVPTSEGAKPRTDQTEERIRQNLIRFREAVGLDQFAAASASQIPYETLRGYEFGEEPVPTQHLKAIATAYGCRAGDFFEEELPDFDTTKLPALHFGGPGTAELTDEERETLRKIAENVSTRLDRIRKAKKRR